MIITPFIRRAVTCRMAIDLGTSRTIIAVEGRGIVLDEPSYIAVNELTSEVVAFGQDAYDMQGREGRNLRVITPVRGGVVSDFERTKCMLGRFVRKCKTGSRRPLTLAIVGTVSDITTVERRALLNAARTARIHKTYVMEGGLAAAFGAGVLPNDKRASGIVDIGAGSTSVTVVAKGSVVHSRSQRFGLEEISTELSDHFRRHCGIQVGLRSLEDLKFDLASVKRRGDTRPTFSVRGRDIQTGRLVEGEIAATDIYHVIERTVLRISRLIGDTLNEVSPEVSADLFERGVILTGRGALLAGLDDRLRNAIDLPVIVSDEPEYATVRGLLTMFGEPELLRKIAESESNLTHHVQIPFEA
jgi:rod shape-determining protein MreB and related proteins